MIINETFMWLYVAYKVGSGLLTIGVVSAICCLTTVIIKGANYEDRDWDKAQPVLSRLLYTTLIIAGVTLSCSSIAPSRDDVKAYAAYAIGKDVATSDEAKRLFNAALKYLEGKK